MEVGMKLGKKLAVGEVVEHSPVEQPVAQRASTDAAAPVPVVVDPVEQPVVAHAEG
jgi:hypothetical protein